MEFVILGFGLGLAWVRFMVRVGGTSNGNPRRLGGGVRPIRVGRGVERDMERGRKETTRLNCFLLANFINVRLLIPLSAGLVARVGERGLRDRA